MLQQGFKGGTRGDTELTQWQNSEKERLAKIMLEHGVEWEQKGTHREHLSVLDYKKKMRAEEVAGLKQQQAMTSRAVDRLEMVLEQKQEKLDSLADADSQLTHAIETKRELAEQAENRLEICQKKSSRISQNLTSFYDSQKFELPQPKAMESARAYKEAKAEPVLRRLQSEIEGWIIKFSNMKTEFELLQRKHETLEGNYSRVCRKIQQENAKISVYENLEKILGFDRIQDLISEHEKEFKGRESLNKADKKIYIGR